ncbi:hypothetical protein DFH09DRAFT_1327319 [Mycena vulgaris]|nr:hypothetical protein DFH09DRAFT_1327319 [Mycena vulgaris]
MRTDHRDITPKFRSLLLAPFRNAALAPPDVSLVAEEDVVQNVNDALFTADDAAGNEMLVGSHLIPASVLRERPDTVGKVYAQLLDAGALEVASFVVAGGQVAANADILWAVHPAWRTAKTHYLSLEKAPIEPLLSLKIQNNSFLNVHQYIIDSAVFQ